MKLRTRINLVVAGLTALFVAVLITAEIQTTRSSVREEIEAANRVAAQLLGRLATIYSREGGSELTLQFLQQLGRVRANNITLKSARGDVLYSSPPPTYKAGRTAPVWFAHVLMPDTTRHIFPLPGGSQLVVEPDTSRAIIDAWDSLLRLLGIAAIMFIAVNGLAFWLVGRALAPFPVIASGLERIQRGDLAFRLPPLRGHEAGVIGGAFNRMAEAVEDKVQAERKAREAETRLEERREMARIVEQKVEEERRLIAHELHDEFGQSVTAIRSLAQAIATQALAGQSPDAASPAPLSADAASAAAGSPTPLSSDAASSDTASAANRLTSNQAAARDPATAEAAKLISDEAARLYDNMHGLIPRLTPLSLDTLGLAATLDNLVKDWQRRYPTIDLSLRQNFSEDLGPSVTLTIYRVVQEGLINALRHAQASKVTIDVESDGKAIAVTVTDDGVGLPVDWSRPGHFGLRGLAERVEHLGGEFGVTNAPPRGVQLKAAIPLGTSPMVTPA